MTALRAAAPVTLPALPDTPAARRAVQLAFDHEPENLANHSLRSYLFAMLRLHHDRELVSENDRESVSEADRELIFFACVLHDLGTAEVARGGPACDQQGADFAAKFLRREGFAEERIDRVWEAVALHTTPGMPARRGPVARLMQLGVIMDFGDAAGAVPADLATAMYRQYPRLDLTKAFLACMVEPGARRPPTSQPLMAELLRRQLANGVTEVGRVTALPRQGRRARGHR